MRQTPHIVYESADDRVLVLAVQRGDMAAFEPLVDRHLQYVRTFLALKAPVSNLVDEVAHETFVFAFRSIDQFTAGTCFRAWLRAIGWNLLRGHIQRYSREQAHLSRFAEEQLWEISGKRTDLQAAPEVDYLEECVAQVPKHLRKLLILKYKQQYSSIEIARQVNRTMMWVRTVLFRLRQQLRDCIERKHAEARA